MDWKSTLIMEKRIVVPKIEGMLYANARTLVEEDGLRIIVSDSGYNKRLAADCVLAQNPGPGTQVEERTYGLCNDKFSVFTFICHSRCSG